MGTGNAGGGVKGDNASQGFDIVVNGECTVAEAMSAAIKELREKAGYARVSGAKEIDFRLSHFKYETRSNNIKWYFVAHLPV